MGGCSTSAPCRLSSDWKCFPIPPKKGIKHHRCVTPPTPSLSPQITISGPVRTMPESPELYLLYSDESWTGYLVGVECGDRCPSEVKRFESDSLSPIIGRLSTPTQLPDLDTVSSCSPPSSVATESLD